MGVITLSTISSLRINKNPKGLVYTILVGIALFFISIVPQTIHAQSQDSINANILINRDDIIKSDDQNISFGVTVKPQVAKLIGENFDDLNLFEKNSNISYDFKVAQVDNTYRLFFDYPSLLYGENLILTLRNYKIVNEEIISEVYNDKKDVSKRVTCSSSSTADVTLDFSGGHCTVCTGSYACSNGYGDWNSGIRTFADPVPAGALVESITVTVNGVGGCSGANTLTAQVNGNTISTGSLDGSCACNSCFDEVLSRSYSSCTEPSFYNYGADNTVTLTVGGGIICIDNIVVSISYCMDEPEITCPSNLTLQCDGAGNTADVNAWLSSVIATDNSSIVSITNDYNSANFSSCNGTGSQLVTFTATDDCSNQVSCQATLTIQDTQAPTGTPPSQTGLNSCFSASLVSFPFNPSLVETSYSDNCGAVTVALTSSSLSGDDNSWTIMYNYTVSDDCGNMISETMTLSGADLTDPIASCMDVMAVLDNTGMITINPKVFYEAKKRERSIEDYIAKQDKWVCDCEKRVPITISGNTTVLTNYQVKLAIPNYSEVNGTYSNILFTSSDQQTEIDHWTQTYNSTTGTVWAEIPSIPVGGTTIYMYYGGCGSSGDANDVFDYFNDFDSTAGATNMNNGGAIAETFQGVSVLTKITNCDPAGVWFSLGFTADDYVMVARETRHNNSQTGCALNRYGLENSSFDGYNINRNGESGNNFSIERRSNGGGGNSLNTSVSPSIAKDTFVITELRRCSATDFNSAELFNSAGTSLASVSGTINNHDYSNFDRFTIRGGRDYRMDYVGVAKYSCNPPTYVFGIPVEDDPEADCMGYTAFLNSAGMISVADDIVDNGSSDNCDNDLDFSLSKTSFDCDDLGANVVTMTVTDDHGNTDQCTATITIIDNTPPTISCPTNVSLGTDIGSCVATGVNLGTPTTSDNCSVESVTNDAPSSFPIGTTVVTWTVKDNSGNMATCQQNVVVADTIKPVITCPSAISVSAGPSCTATGVDLSSVITSDNCGIASTTNNAPDSFPLGITTVTWTVTDIYGNSSTCTQDVTVTDGDPPAITCAADISVAADADCEAKSVILTAPASTDNCSISSVTNNAPSTFPIGETTITWTVTDQDNNMATCQQKVTVVDDTKPSINCPANITVQTDAGVCTASGVSLGSATTSDNCTVASVTNNAPMVYPLGITNVIWTVTDGSGNMSTCTQTVTVEDNEDPTISCPTAVTVGTNSGVCTASGFSLGTPITSDNCGISSVTNNAPTAFPLGNTTVTWTVTDNAGNETICTQTVTVEDNELPVITCPSSFNVGTDPGSCIATSVNLGTAVTSDNCGVFSVTNDAPTTFPLGNTTVTWTVTDNAGTETTCTQTVTVEDNEAPTISCPGVVTVSTDSGVCTATGVSLGTAVTSDNCGVASVTNDAPTTFPLGNTTVTWTVTDNAGTETTCTQTVTVEDNEAPTISCPGVVTVSTDSGVCTATGVSLGTAVTSDNCGVSSVTNDAPTAFPLGNTTVTWTVTDNAGTETTCTQTVTVEDNEAPTISCPGVVTVSTDSGVCTATGVSLGTAVTSDNCGVSSVTNDAPTAFPLGNTTVTWTVTDNAGTETTCTQTVTVEDNEAPTISCPGVVTVSTDSGVCTATGVSLGTAVTSDNCGVSSVTNDAPTAFPLGNTTVTWTVTDNAGTETTCTQTVTVEDNEAPTISCPGVVTVSTDSGVCTATGVSLGTAVTSDNCGVSSVTNDAPTAFPLGNTTVTWTVTDNAGTETTCTQTVTVEDNEAPTISCPGVVTVSTDSGVCTATGVSLGTAVRSDNCGVSSVTNDAPAAFPLGNTTVTWTVTDNAGTETTCTQTVTVEDNEAPTISCPSDITIACSASIDTSDLGVATAMDNCSNTNIIYSDSLVAGSCNGESILYRKWTVIDNSINQTSCTQIISIQDTEAPVLSTPSALGSISCDGVFPAQEELSATDDCSTISIVQDTLPYVVDICNGYSVTYRWIATDACSNADTVDLSFDVLPDTEAPVLSTPSALGSIACDADFPAQEELSATDDCSTISIVQDTLPYVVDICNGYSVTYRWIATDACSNADTVDLSFDVLPDTEAPVLSTPSALGSIACDADFPAQEELSATDDCSTISIVQDTLPYVVDICNGYSVTYRWIATDACSNADTVDLSFDVLPDTEAPVLSTPSALGSIACDADFPAQEELSATDDCSTISIVQDTLPYVVDICNGYSVTYRWIATDACSNADTVDLSFDVLPDTEAPVLSTPSALGSIACDADFPAQEELSATDDCSTISIVQDTLPYVVDICNGYSVTYRWIATDACSNADTVDLSFDVLPDTEAPVLSTPSALGSIACDADFPAQEGLSATDDCSTISIVQDTLPYVVDICNGYSVTYRWIATDACSNADTVDLSFDVLPDTEAPVLSTPSALGSIACDADFPAQEGLSATDDCSTISIVQDTLPYVVDICNGYSVTYRWIATDACSNADTVDLSFDVLPDTEAPVLSTPSALGSIACDGVFPAQEELSATDDCSTISIVQDTLPYVVDICNGYSVTYRWIATDACSNADTVDLSFDVLPDTEAPVLSTPSALGSIACDADFPAQEELSAIDDCSTISIVQDTLPYVVDICNGYSVTYRWIATDACSNADTVDLSFDVLPDTEAPVLSTPSALGSIACDADFPPQEGLSATDDCSTISIVQDTLPYVVDICNGYSVTYRWIATDACSNADTVDLSFDVLPDTEAPVLSTPSALGSIACDADFPAQEELSATDDCSTISIVQDTLPYVVDICNGYSVTYRWIATDACSNADTVDLSFDVLPDTEAPVLSTPSALGSIACDADFPAQEGLSATDDCSTISIVQDTLPYVVDICNGYSVTYRWIATDACSNADTVDLSFDVLPDTEAPVLSTPSALGSIACDADFPAQEELSATDDCSTISIVQDTLPYVVDICNGYSVTYRWIATDACSNADTVDLSFDVLPDTEAPVLSTPSALGSIACDADFPAQEELSATDDCSTISIVQDTLPYVVDICNGYSVTYRWIATDACSNADTVDLSFDVLPDTEAPVLSTPSALGSIACDADFPAQEGLSATDDCSTISIVQDTLPYVVDICNGYSVTYRWIATDACSNADTVDLSFDVLPDTEAPVLSTPSALGSIACDADFPAQEELSATDDCSTISIVQDTLPYVVDICNGYSVTYRWIATDACSNADTVDLSFDVLPDTEAPVLSTPSALGSIACDADFPAQEELSATDDCSTISIVQDTLPYVVDICNGYSVTYRWIATDACSNADTVDLSFDVLPDTEAPVLSTPSALGSIACDADFPAQEELSATDDCSTISIVQDTLPYVVDICNGYSVTYRWIATDACSNADTVDLSFDVLPDTEAPVLSTPSALGSIACDADFPAQEELSATDDCSTISIVQDTLPYVVDICNGYSVTYRWIATDACSNADTVDLSFDVLPDTEAPVLSTPSALGSISCDADFPAQEELSATDDCSTISIVQDTLPYVVDICNGYSVTYRWIATDACSNADTVDLSFDVLPDTEAPVLSTPSALGSIACDADFPAQEGLSATDDCSTISIVQDTLPYVVDICNGYSVTYRWIATDACSNADTVDLSFDVLPDTEAPVLSTPSALGSISCDADFPAQEELSATDDCSTISIVQDTLPYVVDICNGYSVTYRWIATDACSNADTVDLSFDVLPDTEAPVLSTPSALGSIACDADFPAQEGLSATDDCSTISIVQDTLPYVVDICNGYSVTYRWIATDACSNADTVDLSFDVLPDTEAPVLSTPSALGSIACDADFPAQEGLSATDDCSTISIVQDTLPYVVDICNGYSVTYRWIATDACSNADTVDLSFDVLPDTEAPVLSTPSALGSIACDADFPARRIKWLQMIVVQ